MALVRRMMECAAERLTEELQKRYRYAQSQMPDSIAEIVLDLLRVLERYLNVGYRNRDFNASLATYLATLSSHHLDGKRARGQKKEFCSEGVLVRRFRLERRIFCEKNTNFSWTPSVDCIRKILGNPRVGRLVGSQLSWKKNFLHIKERNIIYF